MNRNHGILVYTIIITSSSTSTATVVLSDNATCWTRKRGSGTGNSWTRPFLLKQKRREKTFFNPDLGRIEVLKPSIANLTTIDNWGVFPVSQYPFINIETYHDLISRLNIENHDFSSKIMIFHDFVQKSYKIIQNHAKSYKIIQNQKKWKQLGTAMSRTGPRAIRCKPCSKHGVSRAGPRHSFL